MAAIEESDVLKFATARETVRGVEVTRGFLITGLTSGSAALIEAKAMGPAYGEQHPDDPLIVVIDKETKPFLTSKTQAYLIVSYGPPELIVLPTPVVRFRGTTRGVRTNFDNDRDIIKVLYTDPSDRTYPEVVGQVEGQEAYGVLTSDWIEATNPESWLMPFINAINNSTWRGWPRWTWWVRDIQIEKELYRPGYKCSVVMELDSKTFMKTAAFRNDHGIIPADITFTDKTIGQHEGYTNVLINGEADFSQLKIP